MSRLSQAFPGRGPRRRRGFTLSEVLVGMLLTAVVLVPLFHLFSRGNVGTVMNRDEVLAQAYAGALLDHLLGLGYDRLPPTATPQAMAEVPAGGETLGMAPGFTRFYQVEEIAPAGSLADWPMAYKVVTVTVGWTAPVGMRQFVVTGLLHQGVRR